MTADEVLLKTLQDEFFKDSDGIFDELLEGMANFRKDVSLGLRHILKALHSLKGAAQAIGLPALASFANGMENALNCVQTTCGDSPLSEQDTLRLERLVSGAVRAVEEIFQALASGAKDSPEVVNPYLTALEELTAWKHGVDSSDWGMSSPPSSASSSAKVTTKITVAQVPSPERIAPVVSSEVHRSEGSTAKVSRSLLLLEQRGKTFGVALSAVIEILERRPWCALPIRRRGILGVMNRFGEVLPVVDFQGLLGVKDDDKIAGARGTIVVCRAGGRRFGLPVDNVAQIVEVHEKDLQAASHLEVRRHNGLITDMALLDGKTVHIVDINKFIE